MTMEYKSNYEKVTEDWKKRFLDMDQERLIERFQLNHDGQWLYLRYLGQQLKLSRTSGKVLFADREEIPEFDTVITVYNMFYYAKEHPAASGELVPFRLVKRVYPFERAYQKQILEPFARLFSGHVKELREACEKLGGTELPQGDVGYQINAFECEPMRFYFWDCDDEFEAQGNILFDYSATDFNHVESAVSTAEMGVKRLAELAGLPLRGKSFGMQ